MYCELFIAISYSYLHLPQLVNKISIILIYEIKDETEEFPNSQGTTRALWSSRHDVTQVITGAPRELAIRIHRVIDLPVPISWCTHSSPAPTSALLPVLPKACIHSTEKAQIYYKPVILRNYNHDAIVITGDCSIQ